MGIMIDKQSSDIFSISYFLDDVYCKLDTCEYHSKSEVEDDIIHIHELCKKLNLDESDLPPYIKDAESDLMLLRDTFN